MPEANRAVALKALSFHRQAAEGGRHPMRLAELPTILVSKARNDLRLMAADRPGLDAGRVKKADY